MKKTVLIFIFLLSFITILISQESIKKLLKTANKYYHSSDFDKAIDYYTKIINLDPKFAEAYYNRGKSYEYKREDNIAIKDFIKASKLKKEYENILMKLGYYYFYHEEYDRALLYYMAQIEISPDKKKGILIFLKKSNVFNLKQSFNLKIKKKTQKIRLICKIPDNYDKRQIIYNTEYSIKPSKEFFQNNNKYIEYTIIDPTDDINIDINTKLEILPYDFKIATQKGNKSNLNSSNLTQYLIDERYLEKDYPSIQRVAKLLKKDTELDTVKKTYNFVLKHMKYRFAQGPDKGAVYALENRGDDCSEYSDLFIALCRANNIPARMASGFILTEGELDMGHAWAEVYFNNYGWIPFDPTFDDTEGAKGLTSFENLSNVYIYLNFVRNDNNLKNQHSYYIEWWGDEIDFDYDVIINNTPKENYYYFYNLISLYKKNDIKLFEKSLNELKTLKESFKNNFWEYSIAQYLTDTIKLDTFVSLANDNKEKLCEAYCYIAYKFLFNKQLSNAKDYYEKCNKIELEDNFELFLAKSELNNL